MRHSSAKRKFGRKSDNRRALLRSLANNLIGRNRITTSLAKAKEVRPFIEKLVTLGRKNTLASRRLLISRLGNDKTAKVLAEKISPRYKERQGGYVRIIKLPPRETDGSGRAIIEFV